MADPEENAEIARQLYEHWNARDFDRVAELMADDGEIVLVGSDTRFRGPDGAQEFSRMWADGFPDGRVEIDRSPRAIASASSSRAGGRKQARSADPVATPRPQGGP